MKYPAYVVENDSTAEECPYPGCIKVVCPDLLGYAKTPGPADMEGALLIELMRVSLWVKPHWSSPMDLYVPALGEGVYVEALRDNISQLIWTGFYPGNDFLNLVTMEDGWTGINSNYVEDTDRIIGTRNGSYIKIEDKIDGKITIEVLGQTQIGSGDAEGDGRLGCVIEMDSLADTEKITVKARNKDESTKNEVVFDMTKDAESIQLNQDIGGNIQSVIIDGTADAQNITLTDFAEQVITMDATAGAEKISITDKEGQEILMDPIAKLISMVAGDLSVVLDDTGKIIELTDTTNSIKMEKNTSKLSMKGGALSEVTIDGMLNKIKISNGVFTLKGVLGDLVTAIKNIITTGAPPIHTVNGASQALLDVVKNTEIDILLD